MKKIKKNRARKILDNLTLFLIILIILSGFYWRYFLIIKDYGFMFDEGFNFIQAQNPIKSLITGQYSDVAVHPPLLYIFLHFWSKLSVEELVLRLPFVIAGTIGVLLFFLVAKEIFESDGLALLSAFLFANFAFSIFYSSQVRYTQPLLSLELLAFLFYLKGIKEKKILNWVIFGAVTSVCFYLDYSAIWFLLILNIHFLFFLFKKAWSKVKIKDWLSANLIISIIFFPWLSTFIKNFPLGLKFTSYLGKPAPKAILDVLVSYSAGHHIFFDEIVHLLASKPLSYFLVLTPLSLSLLIVFFSRTKKEEMGKKALILLFSAPLFISFLISQFSPIFQDRNLAIVSVGVLLLIVSSLRFSRNLIVKTAAVISLVFFLTMNVGFLVYFYHNRLTESWREPALFLEKELRPNDTLVAHEGANDWPMLYYLQYRYPYPLKERNIFLYLFEGESKKELLGSLKEGRFWLFGSSWEIESDIKRLGPEGDFWRRFAFAAKDYGGKKGNFELVGKEEITGITIYEGYYSE